MNDLIERLRVLNAGGRSELMDVLAARLAVHQANMESTNDHLTMIREQGAIGELRWLIGQLEYVRQPREAR